MIRCRACEAALIADCCGQPTVFDQNERLVCPGCGDEVECCCECGADVEPQDGDVEPQGGAR